MNKQEKRKKIAIGVEDFKRLIDKNGYFVDKTLMIQKLKAKRWLLCLPVRGASARHSINL